MIQNIIDAMHLHSTHIIKNRLNTKDLGTSMRHESRNIIGELRILCVAKQMCMGNIRLAELP